jgi:phage tail-like protein
MATGPKAAQRGDTLTAARFAITIDDVEIASFSELLAISTEIEPLDVVQAGPGGPAGKAETISRKLPGKSKPATLVLKRGKNNSMEMWIWHEKARNGGADALKSCSLVMYNFDGTPVARYHLEHAWPSKLEIGTMAAGSQGAALVETVTIVAERIQRV